MLRRFALVPFLCACGMAQAQFTGAEIKALSDALFIKNLTLQDLNGSSAHLPYSLDFVNTCQQKPLEGASRLMAIQDKALDAKPSVLIALARKNVLGDLYEMRQPLPPFPHPVLPSTIPEQLRGPVAQLAIARHQADAYCAEAVSALTPAEREELLDSFPALASGDPERRFSNVLTQPLNREKSLELLAKVNLPLIRRAAEVLAIEAERAMPHLKAAARETWAGESQFDYLGQRIVVSGKSNVRWNLPANALLIDFGSHNTYTGHEGAGELGAAMLFSFGLNNAFEQNDAAAGTGLLGIGLAYDFGGSTFKGGSFAFGCGIGGVGLLRENGSDASISSDQFAEGYGEFGIGLLSGGPGKPEYRANAFAQGSARTMGVGWLVSKQANALISLTGAFGQGCSLGYSDGQGEMGGGVGLLSKRGGKCTFLGGSTCQAAAEDGGLGTLFGADANDIFIADEKAQSYGTANGFALLFHLEGDPSLLVKATTEPTTGSDGATFSMIRGGRSSGPASSRESVSIVPANPGANQEVSRVQVAANGISLSATVSPTSSGEVGLLGNGMSESEHAVAAAYAEKVRPGKAPIPPGEFLEHSFETASNEAASEEVRAQATAQLATYGYPGFGWLLQAELGHCGRGGRITIAALAQALGSNARNALALKVADGDDAAALSALQICVDNHFEECEPLILGALARPRLAAKAAEAAGEFKLRETVGTLMLLAGQLDPDTSLASARALADIADPQSLSTAEALLGSNDHRIVDCAIQLLAELPGGFDVAKELARDPDETIARKGIRILSYIGTEPALDRIGTALSDMRSGVRIEAILALNRRVPEKYRAKFQDLKNDPAPLVQAVLAGLQNH